MGGMPPLLIDRLVLAQPRPLSRILSIYGTRDVFFFSIIIFFKNCFGLLITSGFIFE